MRYKTIIVSALSLSVLATTTQAQNTGDLFKALATQTLRAVMVSNAPTAALPPKPAGMMLTLRIGPSELFVTPEIRDRMGGTDITSIGRQRIQDLLASSGRFTVTDDATAAFRFIASVSDFQAYEIEMKSKSAATALANQFLKANIKASQAPINWEKDDSLVIVKCSVALNFEDTRTRQLLFSGQGTFERKSILSALRAEVSGVEAVRNAGANNLQSPPRMNEHEIKMRLVEYATHQALKDMLPKLDAYLLGLQPGSAGTVPSQPAAGGAAIAVPQAPAVVAAAPVVPPPSVAVTAPPVVQVAAPPVQVVAPAPIPVAAAAVPAAPPAAPPATPAAPAVTPAPAVKPKFCTNCGNRLDEDNKFCGNCGTAVKR